MAISAENVTFHQESHIFSTCGHLDVLDRFHSETAVGLKSTAHAKYAACPNLHKQLFSLLVQGHLISYCSSTGGFSKR